MKFDKPEVQAVFAHYPKMALALRELIFKAAAALAAPCDIDECLKWGEPAYLCKNGSTIRIAWKASKPDQIALYFNCKTRLIETFREIHADELQFEGNRAIILGLDQGLDGKMAVLGHCIALALQYHSLKKLPLLGA